MIRFLILSLICLCAFSFFIGRVSAPYGVPGFIYSYGIFFSAWSIGVLTGFFGALAARGG